MNGTFRMTVRPGPPGTVKRFAGPALDDGQGTHPASPTAASRQARPASVSRWRWNDCSACPGWSRPDSPVRRAAAGADGSFHRHRPDRLSSADRHENRVRQRLGGEERKASRRSAHSAMVMARRRAWVSATATPPLRTTVPLQLVSPMVGASGSPRSATISAAVCPVTAQSILVHSLSRDSAICEHSSDDLGDVRH